MIGVRWGKRRVTTNKQDVDNKGQIGTSYKKEEKLINYCHYYYYSLSLFASVSIFH